MFLEVESRGEQAKEATNIRADWEKEPRYYT